MEGGRAAEWTRNSGASADETGGFGAAAFARQTEQNQSRAQHPQADDARNEKVRMLIVKRVRVRRPRLVGLSSGQQSEPAGKTDYRLHALMLRSDLEKSSLGLSPSWSQRFGSSSPLPSPSLRRGNSQSPRRENAWNIERFPELSKFLPAHEPPHPLPLPHWGRGWPEAG